MKKIILRNAAKVLSQLLLYISLLIVGLAGCKPDKGKPAIGKEEMASFLAEYYELQATIACFGTLEQEKREDYYHEILNRHHITEAEFDSSFVWYTRNMEELDIVYQLTYDKLSAKKDSLQRMLK